ncbi:MAG TPA: hypothetical protein VLG38_05455 [Gammaproteobacteria bacterium]|nr:hypothetical protein [Gammaproteobacteria bacterium]
MSASYTNGTDYNPFDAFDDPDGDDVEFRLTDSPLRVSPPEQNASSLLTDPEGDDSEIRFDHDSSVTTHLSNTFPSETSLVPKSAIPALLAYANGVVAEDPEDQWDQWFLPPEQRFTSRLQEYCKLMQQRLIANESVLGQQLDTEIGALEQSFYDIEALTMGRYIVTVQIWEQIFNAFCEVHKEHAWLRDNFPAHLATKYNTEIQLNPDDHVTLNNWMQEFTDTSSRARLTMREQFINKMCESPMQHPVSTLEDICMEIACGVIAARKLRAIKDAQSIEAHSVPPLGHVLLERSKSETPPLRQTIDSDNDSALQAVHKDAFRQIRLLQQME